MQEVQSAADYNHFIYRDFICQIVWEGVDPETLNAGWSIQSALIESKNPPL